MTYIEQLFSLDGQTAIVTGGTGVIGGAIARGLARAGARVAILGRRRELAEEVAAAIAAGGGEAMALPADVLDQEQLTVAREIALARWGKIDILVNAAGGHVPGSVAQPGQTIFDLPFAAIEQTVDLNFHGTLLPTQVIAQAMARAGRGSILNISSMAALRPLTRTAGYGAAKAAIDNLTRWLAVDLARAFGPGLRVNAIAPGFFLGEQNRALLTNPDGTPTARGQAILDHSPAGRFGEADELVAAAIWLCGPGAAFVNGAVVPVDGGFSSFAGV